MTTVPRSGLRITFLDDDAEYGLLFKRALERQGHSVTAFQAARDALAALRAAPGSCDLFVSDYNMPGANGLEVVRAALILVPGLRCAVVSSDAEGVARAKAPDPGAPMVSDKPYTLEEFARFIEHARA